jgi:hypothetical protein
MQPPWFVIEPVLEPPGAVLEPPGAVLELSGLGADVDPGLGSDDGIFFPCKWFEDGVDNACLRSGCVHTSLYVDLIGILVQTIFGLVSLVGVFCPKEK